jgi:hypothetical protein
VRFPVWLKYGGRAWLPEVGIEVQVPERVYAVVDLVDDNFGEGLVIDTGSLQAVVDYADLPEVFEIGVPTIPYDPKRMIDALNEWHPV